VIATTAAMEFVMSAVTGQVVTTWLSEEQFVARSTKAHFHAMVRLGSASSSEQNRLGGMMAGWLRHRYPADEGMRLAHETIYVTLF
jgi:hypothetical protein